MASSSSFYAVLLAVVMATICITGVKSAIFTIRNNCPYTIWPGALTAAKSPPLSSTGFQLAAGSSQSVGAPAGWSGRFWARTHCSLGARFTCPIGDCGSGQIRCNGAGGAPPVSLVEFTLNGNGGQDFYDVSLVDGFNLPVSVAPQRGGCKTTSCGYDINRDCPNELAVRDSNNGVIGCKSACLVFNKPEYCCTSDHDKPETCPPTSYSNIFKSRCPQAYSYAYDDHTSTFTCPSGGDYVITFCP